MQKNKLELPFDPTYDVFRWGPIPGKFLYISVFNEVHFKHFRAKYNENWSETINLFKDGRMFWVNNAKDVAAAGESVFLRYLLPVKTREQIYTEWLGYVEKMREIQEKIDVADFPALSDMELLDLWNSFNNVYIKFWTTGSVPELANYGSVEYLDKELKKYISDDVGRAHILMELTAPTKISFYQEEEIELSKTNDTAAHQRQYFWLKNSYAGTQILPESFFAERKTHLAATLEKDILIKLEEQASAKSKVQEEFHLPKEIMDTTEAVCDGIVWQDERKKYIFIILHYIDTFVKEIARRFGYEQNDFDNLWYFEIAEIIKGKDLRAKIAERKHGFGMQFFHTYKEFSPEETAYLWDIYDSSSAESTSELKGTVASKGNGKKITGRVHILLDPTKNEEFKEGEILVAPMTSPEYIFAMRKACAVLTDTGGLTSHAAIVSRELGIPCIVGTKSATKIFKNGDVVEVDAVGGIARKIK